MKKKIREIDKAKLVDGAFINNTTKAFSLSYPDEIENEINHLKESLKHPQSKHGLTPFEFILRGFEDEAKKILINAGISIDLSDIWESLWLWKKHGIYSRGFDIRTANAGQILLSAMLVRDDIIAGEPELVALDMMRLCFAAVGANLHDVVITGIRAKWGRSKGGKHPTRCEGIYQVMKKLILTKNLSGEQWWRWFKREHSEDKPIEYEEYEIYFYDDYLWERAEEGKEKSITKGTFLDYLTQIKKIG